MGLRLVAFNLLPIVALVALFWPHLGVIPLWFASAWVVNRVFA